MGFIKNLFSRKKKGDDDWVFAESPEGEINAIPAHGNHPVFETGGAVIIPKEVLKEKARLNGKSSNKKYFFT